MPTRKPLKYNTFFFVQILSLVQRTETAKNVWLEVIGDEIEFLSSVCFPQQNNVE